MKTLSSVIMSLLFLAATAEAQLLSKLQDYPMFRVKMSVLVEKARSESVEIRWNHNEGKSCTTRAGGVGGRIVEATKDSVSYTKIFDVVQKIFNSHKVLPTTKSVLEANENRKIKNGHIDVGSQAHVVIEVGEFPDIVRFDIVKYYQPKQYAAAEELMELMKAELDPEQLQAIAKATAKESGQELAESPEER